jgi:hypothetical protein
MQIHLAQKNTGGKTGHSDHGRLVIGYIDRIHIAFEQGGFLFDNIRQSTPRRSAFTGYRQFTRMPTLFPVRFPFSLCQILSENFAGTAAPACSPVLG